MVEAHFRLLICLLGLTPFGLLIPLAFGGLGVLLPIAGAAVVSANVIIASFRQSYAPVMAQFLSWAEKINADQFTVTCSFGEAGGLCVLPQPRIHALELAVCPPV